MQFGCAWEGTLVDCSLCSHNILQGLTLKLLASRAFSICDHICCMLMKLIILRESLEVDAISLLCSPVSIKIHSHLLIQVRRLLLRRWSFNAVSLIARKAYAAVASCAAKPADCLAQADIAAFLPSCASFLCRTGLCTQKCTLKSSFIKAPDLPGCCAVVAMMSRKCWRDNDQTTTVGWI